MRKPTRQFLLAILLLLGILQIVLVSALVLFGIVTYQHLNPPVYIYDIGVDEALTETAAIEFTRQAIIDDGKSKPEMFPMPNIHGSTPAEADQEVERIFARNGIDPNQGLVIWSVGYNVTIKRDRDKVECQVYKPK